MKPSTSDLLDYRLALYAGKSMPLDVQLEFVEKALRGNGVISPVGGGYGEADAYSEWRRKFAPKFYADENVALPC